jgi:hypothetical protein
LYSIISLCQYFIKLHRWDQFPDCKVDLLRVMRGEVNPVNLDRAGDVGDVGRCV